MWGSFCWSLWLCVCVCLCVLEMTGWDCREILGLKGLGNASKLASRWIELSASLPLSLSDSLLMQQQNMPFPQERQPWSTLNTVQEYHLYLKVRCSPICKPCKHQCRAPFICWVATFVTLTYDIDIDMGLLRDTQVSMGRLLKRTWLPTQGGVMMSARGPGILQQPWQLSERDFTQKGTGQDLQGLFNTICSSLATMGKESLALLLIERESCEHPMWRRWSSSLQDGRVKP